MWFFILVFCPFLLLSNIPLCGYSAIHLSPLPLVDTCGWWRVLLHTNLPVHVCSLSLEQTPGKSQVTQYTLCSSRVGFYSSRVKGRLLDRFCLLSQASASTTSLPRFEGFAILFSFGFGSFHA